MKSIKDFFPKRFEFCFTEEKKPLEWKGFIEPCTHGFILGISGPFLINVHLTCIEENGRISWHLANLLINGNAAKEEKTPIGGDQEFEKALLSHLASMSEWIVEYRPNQDMWVLQEQYSEAILQELAHPDMPNAIPLEFESMQIEFNPKDHHFWKRINIGEMVNHSQALEIILKDDEIKMAKVLDRKYMLCFSPEQFIRIMKFISNSIERPSYAVTNDSNTIAFEIPAWGNLRKESVPINEQIIDLFQQGYCYSKIRAGLGYDGLQFDDFLKIIGVSTNEEYMKKYLNIKNKERYKAGGSDNKKEALERDGHKCAVCGSTVGLNVHHIVEFSVSENSQLDNLITLCHLHHAATHAKISSFRFHEYCLLAGEGTGRRYTLKNLEEVKQHLSSSGVCYTEKMINDKADMSMLRYMNEYVGYVNSKFPVKLEVSPPTETEDGSISFFRIIQRSRR